MVNVHGGRARYHPALHDSHLKIWMDLNGEDDITVTNDTKEKATEASCEEYLTCLALCIAHKDYVDLLTTDLDNDYLKGKDNFFSRRVTHTTQVTIIYLCRILLRNQY